MMNSTPSSETANTQRRWVLVVILIGLILVAVFSFRAIRSFIQIQRTGLQPGETDVELIRGWMTVPYIARVYDVPEEYIFTSLHLSPQEHQQSSLSDINRLLKPGQPGYALDQVKEAIRQYKRTHPPQETPTPP